MTGLKRSNIRMVNGITITLSATESTGFSPVGHLTDQIVDELRETVIDITEGNGDGKENKDVMGCGRCAVDRGMSRAGIRTRAADRCGGILIPPGGIWISGKGPGLTARALSI